MLTYRNTNILFILVLIIIAALDTQYRISWFAYVVLAVAYSSILFYGCYFISSNFFLPVTCSASTSKKEVALSFDDGPHSNTIDILAVLKRYNVEAAFFCIGNRISGNEHILKKVHENGHLIGNHSYSHHFWFDLFSARKMLHDLRTADEAIIESTGLRPWLFRPPYGVINPNLKKAITKGNYIPIGWSVRSMDTVIKDEARLLEKISKSLKPGAIYLFHDTSKTTLAVLPAFLELINKSGYKLVRLDKLLNLKAYV